MTANIISRIHSPSHTGHPLGGINIRSTKSYTKYDVLCEVQSPFLGGTKMSSSQTRTVIAFADNFDDAGIQLATMAFKVFYGYDVDVDTV